MPIACRLGTDCWLMNYPDVSAAASAIDPVCGPRTYAGHKGTDIAVRDHTAMRRGVEILAAASGTVLRVRDNVIDRAVLTETDRQRVGNQECGNGILVDHRGGWETQYCHLRRGSLAVKSGQRVKRGQKLGLVGLSGLTAFPHIHITIRRDRQVIAPLTGRKRSDPCGKPVRSLWLDPAMAQYRQFDLYAAGMADGAVSKAELNLDAGGVITLPRTAPALVLWAAVFGVKAGDRIKLEIFGPNGATIHRTERTIKRQQARHIMYSGKKRRAAPWAAGRYQGRATMQRGGQQPIKQTRLVQIDVR